MDDAGVTTLVTTVVAGFPFGGLAFLLFREHRNLLRDTQADRDMWKGRAEECEDRERD